MAAVRRDGGHRRLRTRRGQDLPVGHGCREGGDPRRKGGTGQARPEIREQYRAEHKLPSLLSHGFWILRLERLFAIGRLVCQMFVRRWCC